MYIYIQYIYNYGIENNGISLSLDEASITKANNF